MGNHHKNIELYVILSPFSSVVPGLPWLKKTLYALDILLTVFFLVFASDLSNPALPVSVSTWSHWPPSVPSEYGDLNQVFSKDPALLLPPHGPYYCAVDLLPGAPLPTTKLHNLSKPEKEAVEKCIQDFLATGLIQPPSSPVGAGVLLLKRKLFAPLYWLSMS